VSGTELNNQWQSLNDTVQKLGTQLIRLVQLSTRTNAAHRQQLQQQVDSLHRRISQSITLTGQRNRQNVLGKYIMQNYKEPEFKD
jgi:phage terminase large subunit GpA-like protein